MATSDFFADTYAGARDKFLSAARAARCDLFIYRLPNHMGPDGQELTIDVGKLGSAEPQALLVLISGTHGVEGFCGSGCQVGFLIDRLYEALPVNCGALLVHPLNNTLSGIAHHGTNGKAIGPPPCSQTCFQRLRTDPDISRL